MHDGFRKAFATDTRAIAAGATAQFGGISLPSAPALDALNDHPQFDEITIYIAVATTGPVADLTLAAGYRFQPVKNGAIATFGLTPSGLSVVQTVPSAPGASVAFSVTSGGAAAHSLTVAFGAHAAPGCVEDPEVLHELLELRQ